MNWRRLVGSSVLCCLSFAGTATADSFGSGDDKFSIKFVKIDDPGNAPDTTGIPNPAGSVAKTFRIGKYEISESMIDKANAAGALNLSHDDRGRNKPATSISWIEAAQFVNWLNTSTGRALAYKFTSAGDFQPWAPDDPGYDPANPHRSSLARYFLPTVHEWYKAAYYDPLADVYYDYPTGSNTVPTPVAGATAPHTAVYGQSAPAHIMRAGGLSPFGTMAQGGNVAEMLETPEPNFPNYHALRGGWWAPGSGRGSLMTSTYLWAFAMRTQGEVTRGFRVAALVPEAATVALAACASALVLGCRRRKVDRFD